MLQRIGYAVVFVQRWEEAIRFCADLLCLELGWEERFNRLPEDMRYKAVLPCPPVPTRDRFRYAR